MTDTPITPRKSAAITIDAASKIYVSSGQRLHALHDVSLTIEKGDIYGIIGLSGAGKSTLIRSLARLVDLSSGSIYFNGKDISHLTGSDLRAFRKKIGMIFQHFNLFSSRTVAENISYPLEIARTPTEKWRRRVHELLELVGLTAQQHCYPSQLSGGEKQRVGIARAIAHYPELLLCDEATSALDPKTTKEILDLLLSINRQLGVTIVLITHEMDVIRRICNQVAVIEKGAIVEKGSTIDVFAQPSHPTTRHFLQHSLHEIPEDFLKALSPSRKLLRLRFKGKAAGEPLISHMVKRYHVDANILLGWIDRLRTTTVGTLIVELQGAPEHIRHALIYLHEQGVHFEEISS